MRTSLLVGLAGLALVGGVIDAEARARIRIGAFRSRVADAATFAPAAGLALRPNGARPTYVLLPAPVERAAPAEAKSTAPVEAKAASPAPAPEKPVAAAAPWCRSRNVVGTGAGFCLIN